MTKELPTKEGYYWWVQKFDGCLSEKGILYVKNYGSFLHASGGQFDFAIKPNTDDGFEDYWQYIPEPEEP